MAEETTTPRVPFQTGNQALNASENTQELGKGQEGQGNSDIEQLRQEVKDLKEQIPSEVQSWSDKQSAKVQDAIQKNMSFVNAEIVKQTGKGEKVSPEQIAELQNGAVQMAYAGKIAGENVDEVEPSKEPLPGTQADPVNTETNLDAWAMAEEVIAGVSLNDATDEEIAKVVTSGDPEQYKRSYVAALDAVALRLGKPRVSTLAPRGNLPVGRVETTNPKDLLSEGFAALGE